MYTVCARDCTGRGSKGGRTLHSKCIELVRWKQNVTTGILLQHVNFTLALFTGTLEMESCLLTPGQQAEIKASNEGFKEAKIKVLIFLI